MRHRGEQTDPSCDPDAFVLDFSVFFSFLLGERFHSYPSRYFKQDVRSHRVTHQYHAHIPISPIATFHLIHDALELFLRVRDLLLETERWISPPTGFIL